MPLVPTTNMKKIAPQFVKAADVIKNAIEERRPVIITHHNDADGIMGGYIMETAVSRYVLQYNLNNNGRYKSQIKRIPSPTPYYDIKDALNHIQQFQREVIQFGKPGGCVIVIDNGCTIQDFPSLKRMKACEHTVVVIDHHFPGESVNGKFAIDSIADAHVSPHYPDIGVNPSDISAGLLAAETAYCFMPSVKDIAYLTAAISLFGDGCIAEEYEQCMKKIPGYTPELIEQVTFALNYECASLRFNTTTPFIEFLMLLSDKKHGIPYIKEVYDEGQKLKDDQLEISKANCKIEDFANKTVCITLDLDDFVSRKGYPSSGKALSHLHWWYCEEPGNEEKPVIAMGIMDDAVVFRANNVKKTLGQAMEFLKEKFPNAGLDGGGHDNAGTIRFMRGYHEQIITGFREFYAC